MGGKPLVDAASELAGEEPAPDRAEIHEAARTTTTCRSSRRRLSRERLREGAAFGAGALRAAGGWDASRRLLCPHTCIGSEPAGKAG